MNTPNTPDAYVPGQTAHRVLVIGGGVIGLSVAHELATARHAVTIVAEAPAAETVSAVAGGLWFPYAVTAFGLESVAVRSLARFQELATRPETHVVLREGTYVERGPNADRSWTADIGWYRDALREELPPGADRGVRTRLPLADTPHYLKWLEGRCAALGVSYERGRIASIDEAIVRWHPDLVVVAAGLASATLVGDDDRAYPISGQIVRLTNPGLSDWLLDEQNPAGMTYVLPRGDDVVCGGTSVVGGSTTWDPDTERGILARARVAVPALADATILGRDVGLRPGRDSLRIESLDGHPVPVIACYGHGGAGITLSWGSAERVAQLTAAAFIS